MTNLLVVESPAKAKTISQYLGKDYRVLASFGHIRDLPSKDGSIDTKKDFAIKYRINPAATKTVAAINEAMKKCNKLMLAPDPDREGEAIAWHVYEVLKNKKTITDKTPVERITFNAITKDAVTKAVKNPRSINMDLVNAQQARRALDYLVGFNLSPVLWRKLPGSKSAGRVQSVALRLIVEREDEIKAFKAEEYWKIKADFLTEKKEDFVAWLTHINDKKLDKLAIKNEKNAQEIVNNLNQSSFQIIKIEKKQVKRRPYAPFTTSSLQQDSYNKLGFSAKKTMMLAQKLYEGFAVNGQSKGLITYMRTDSVAIEPQAINEIRNFIKQSLGEKYLPKKANIYKSKVKNAQEAHEAIRPTDFSLPPEKLINILDGDHLKLYELIWKRSISSQTSDAILNQVAINIASKSGEYLLRANGSNIYFDGFYAIYKDSAKDQKENFLPDMKENDKPTLQNVIPSQHFTEPPPRYNEASLVKKMEELGIGRPSTYATIISVIQDRGYVRLENKRFFAEARGQVVTYFLKEFFARYVEYDYTASLEDELDDISNGKIDWKSFLGDFWEPFYNQVQSIMGTATTEVINKVSDKIAPDVFKKNEKGEVENKCPECSNGILSVKMSKFGPFIGCNNYPDCRYIKSINKEGSTENNDVEDLQKPEGKLLGCQENKNIYLKKGPYGFYLQLGENDDKKKKRFALPRNYKPEDVDLKKAQSLLSLPRKIGNHPDGKIIESSIGRFGPYLKHDGKFYSLKEDDFLTVGINRAVDVIEDLKIKKANKTKANSKNVKNNKSKITTSKTTKKSVTKQKSKKSPQAKS